jgi:hypothetical protein
MDLDCPRETVDRAHGVVIGRNCAGPSMGGRPRLISDDDLAVIVATAKTRPGKRGCSFT